MPVTKDATWDILGSIRLDWDQQTEAMLTLTAGMIMVQHGLTTVALSLEQADVNAFTDANKVLREYLKSPDGKLHVRFTLDAADQSLVWARLKREAAGEVEYQSWSVRNPPKEET